MQSFKKKVLSLMENGTDPLLEGMHNFKAGSLLEEMIAKKRAGICKGCEFFVEEPIFFLKVEDKKIPELSNKMCDECGCTLSYKLRQSITKCDKWLD